MVRNEGVEDTDGGRGILYFLLSSFTSQPAKLVKGEEINVFNLLLYPCCKVMHIHYSISFFFPVYTFIKKIFLRIPNLPKPYYV